MQPEGCCSVSEASRGQGKHRGGGMGAEKKFSPYHTLYFWLLWQQGGRQVADNEGYQLSGHF